MRRIGFTVAWCVLAFALGIVVVHLRGLSAVRTPDAPTVISRMREVARLETLDVTVFKKISFAPDPRPSASLWGAVFTWAKATLAPSRGKAIVFADVHVGLDLEKLDPGHLQLSGDTARVVLPPLTTSVELRPGDTEIIDSNLDSAQTAQLLQLAKDGFAQDASADRALQARARDSAKRAITGLLSTLGFTHVEFVEALPRANAG